jgi:hypothetical protein
MADTPAPDMRSVGLAILVVAVGLILWVGGGEAATSIDVARSCLAGQPGFEVVRDSAPSGPEQLLVTTPSGRRALRSTESEATVFLTFFASEDDAEKWAAALDDFTDAVKSSPGDGLVGTVYADWSARVPGAEREAVLGCLGE